MKFSQQNLKRIMNNEAREQSRTSAVPGIDEETERKAISTWYFYGGGRNKTATEQQLKKGARKRSNQRRTAHRWVHPWGSSPLLSLAVARPRRKKERKEERKKCLESAVCTTVGPFTCCLPACTNVPVYLCTVYRYRYTRTLTQHSFSHSPFLHHPWGRQAGKQHFDRKKPRSNSLVPRGQILFFFFFFFYLKKSLFTIFIFFFFPSFPSSSCYFFLCNFTV